ncbi:hypothetical protein Ancab_021203 [Ancistrocladus abbreviatus]
MQHNISAGFYCISISVVSAECTSSFGIGIILPVLLYVNPPFSEEQQQRMGNNFIALLLVFCLLRLDERFLLTSPKIPENYMLVYSLIYVDLNFCGKERVNKT